MAWLLMDDGWLLFDGVFLRLPIFLRAGVCVLCAALLQFVALWRRQRLQIQSLRYGTISVASLLCADARPCVLAAIGLAVQPCSLVPLGGSVLQASTKRKEVALEESRGPIEIWCLLVSYRPASSASIELIELNEQPRG